MPTQPTNNPNTSTNTGAVAGVPFTTFNGRNEIHVTHLDIPTIVSKVWNEVIVQNDPPQIFRRGSKLVRIEEKDNGDKRLVDMDRDRMRGFLARACIFTDAWTGKIHVVEPPRAVVSDMLVNIDPRVPIIDRIVYSPIFASDDTIVDTPGYNEIARVYYDVPFGLFIPKVSDEPDEDELADARSLFEEMIVDFPFEGEADKAHAYALCLQMFCRDKIDGPTPLYGSESPTVGSGKGMLVDALLKPALGLRHHTISQPNDDDEWRKQMVTSLREGPPVIKIDNVTRPMDSGVFANILTTDEFGSRILGTMDNVSIPVRCGWVMTANNPVLSTELARRYVRMRLIPDVDKPWLRDKFKHKDLLGWVAVKRGQLIWAALTMIRYGIQHNPHNFHRIGSFEAWADTMGNILDAIGVSGFLGNINDIYEQSDVETSTWTNLVSWWWATHHSDDVSSSELYAIVKDNDISISLRGKDEHALKTSMGRAVAKMKDRVFSISDGSGNQIVVRIVKSTKVVMRAVRWELQNITPVAAPAPTTDIDPDDPQFDDLTRERMAIDAAGSGDFDTAEQLIDVIDDPIIKDRCTLAVEAIQYREDV